MPGAQLTAPDSAVEREPAHADLEGALVRMEHAVQDSMQALIDAICSRCGGRAIWLEIEINTDILFASGASDFSPAAEPVLDKLAEVLKPFPNPIRVEGHTDNRPIRTAAFPSNWELSAARAASVVHQFTRARESIPCASRSSASENSARGSPIPRRRDATPIGEWPSWS